MSPARTFGRRPFLTAMAAALTAPLAACDDSTGTAPGTTGSWSFTDDTGNAATLPQRPKRIAGLTDAISSLWNYGIEPVATFGYMSLRADPAFAGKDIGKVTEVGRTYGEISLEGLAAAEPDLVITHVYPANGGQLKGNEVLYGFSDQTQVDSVRKIAPIVALKMGGTADRVVQRTNELAAALGADFSSPALVRARHNYKNAEARLSAAGRRGLSVMAEAAYSAQGLYIAKASDDPSLARYAQLGVHFHDPGGDDYYWQHVTWEQVTRHRTDVVLNSVRAMSVKEALQQPTFATLPAARAGQVCDWNSQNMDYLAQARNMNYLAGCLERSRKVT